MLCRQRSIDFYVSSHLPMRNVRSPRRYEPLLETEVVAFCSRMDVPSSIIWVVAIFDKVLNRARARKGTREGSGNDLKINVSHDVYSKKMRKKFNNDWTKGRSHTVVLTCTGRLNIPRKIWFGSCRNWSEQCGDKSEYSACTVNHLSHCPSITLHSLNDQPALAAPTLT